ncbi:MAG: DegQ family serine endoprotease [Hyphomicrobiales bacterium]
MPRIPSRSLVALAAALALTPSVNVIATAPAAAQQAPTYGPASVADLAAKLSPAVVNIATSQKVAGQSQVPKPDLPPGSPFRDFFDDLFKDQPNGGQNSGRRVNSLGSGFVVDPSGIIVTNNHVIEDADEIEVNFADGTTLKAQLKGRDTETDLAVLQITPPPAKPLPFVKFGDSDIIRVGDWVMAIGNPFGLGGSVTMGIVSARNRNINSGPYDDFIQTDAAINRGNSGGPLFNMQGDVVGINTAIISPSGGSIGIGFSVPANSAKRVVEQLVAYGETRRGWLGVKIQEVTEDLAKTMKLDKAEGALIADVTATGPAEKAGIKPGDVVVKFDGHEVKAMRDLPRIVADTPVGKKVQVEVMRKGQPITVEVEIGRLEEGKKIAESGAKSAEAVTATVLGMKLSTLTPELRQRYRLDDKAEGALVVEVAKDSPAAEKGVEPGDVISVADDQKVSAPADVQRQIDKAKGEGQKSILVVVLKASRKGDPHFISLRLE